MEERILFLIPGSPSSYHAMILVSLPAKSGKHIKIAVTLWVY